MILCLNSFYTQAFRVFSILTYPFGVDFRGQTPTSPWFGVVSRPAHYDKHGLERRGLGRTGTNCSSHWPSEETDLVSLCTNGAA